MTAEQKHLENLEGKGKKDKVRNMFNSIAGKYDFLNHFLSFGIDYHWRQQVLKIMKSKSPDTVLDIATGTGDLAILARKSKAKKIIGLDISEEMLAVGKQKLNKRGLEELIELQVGDSENLPFESNTFDIATVSFGVRNFENLEKGLSEIYRVLKTDGSIIVLEFSQPKKFPMKHLYSFYSSYILPFFGKIISGDSRAYTYLPESVKVFPAYNDFLDVMKSAGFKNTSWIALTSGITCIYTGDKV